MSAIIVGNGPASLADSGVTGEGHDRLVSRRLSVLWFLYLMRARVKI